ncbi:MAG: ATP-binding cassette domain-containing protein, partial [Oscillospiraceae bacterium]|nr:ATP-binding cassette domain-containing protein [Oscillospiraceae bacterium]
KDFPASVWEVALSGRRNQHQVLPFYTAEDKRVARENLERLGAGAWRAKSFRALSGGQQQRVLLARALCACSKLLLLDEPCTGLDPMAAGELYDMLTKLNRAGTAVLMVSHDVAAAAARSNKILHLQTEPLFFGGTEEYLASPAGRRMMGGAANV